MNKAGVEPSYSRSSSLNVNAPDFTPSSFDYASDNLIDQLFVCPGDVLVPSGKFSRPTQPPGKSYFKDEVVIRNSDSGKGKLKDLFF